MDGVNVFLIFYSVVIGVCEFLTPSVSRGWGKGISTLTLNLAIIDIRLHQHGRALPLGRSHADRDTRSLAKVIEGKADVPYYTLWLSI